MAEKRDPRDNLSRDKQARAVFVPVSSLPDPDPEPGWAYRWVATHVNGQVIPGNASRSMREGWEPVKAEDHPELMLTGNASTGNVEFGGLMLCKKPVEKETARFEYYTKQARDQVEAVDNHFLRNNDARMPLIMEKSSEITRGARFGSGSK